MDTQPEDPPHPEAYYSTRDSQVQDRKDASSYMKDKGETILTSYPTVLWGFVTTKKNPDTTILHVELLNEEFDYLAKMRGTRKWRNFFKDIQDDARKAAELTQELREKVEFLETQLKRRGAIHLAPEEG